MMEEVGMNKKYIVRLAADEREQLKGLVSKGKAAASDLNPVAVLLNKVVLEYIPKYGKRLA